MLDILLSRLREEIAIDGYSGSSIDSVWGYVETISRDIANDLGAKITPLVDDKYKSFIWNYLKLEKELEFYENVADMGQSNTNDPETMQVDTRVHEQPYDDLLKAYLDEPIIVPKKRKQPPKAKKKAPPKKKAKPKKAKAKKRSSVKSSAVNSDDDFDANVQSDESSSEESDFEQDESDEDSENSDAVVESEENDSEVETTIVKKQLAKNRNTKTTKKKSDISTVKPVLNRLDDVSQLSYEQVKEQYGSRLYITGTYEFQQIQLYTGVPPGANLSPNLLIILQEILRARSRGLLQADITKIIGIDSRSTGHYCKSLEEKGAIVRNGVSTLKMRTNVCIHARFTAKKQSLDITDQEVESVPYNVNNKGETFSQLRLRNDLTDLIMESPDNAILSEDVLRALAFDNSRKSVRKWFNRTVDELCVKGYLKKTNFRENNKGRAQRCLHLVNLPEEKKSREELPMDEIIFPFRIRSIRSDVPIIPTLVDCSLESQVLHVLKAASDRGATQKEIGFALNTDEGRILYKIMEKMCELTDIGLQRYGAGRLLEFEGRQRRYRYYTYKTYKMLHEGIDLEIPPLPEQDMDESGLFEADYSVDAIRTAKGFRTYLNSTTSRIISVKGAGRKTDLPIKKGRPKKSAVDENGVAVPKSKYVRKVPLKSKATKTNKDTTPSASISSDPTFSIEFLPTGAAVANAPTSPTAKRSIEKESNEPSKKARHDADITIDVDANEAAVIGQPQSSTAPAEQASVVPPTILTSAPTDVPNKEAPTKKPRLFDIFSNTRKASINKSKAPATSKPVEATQTTRDPVSGEKDTISTENVATETNVASNETPASTALDNTSAISNETASSATSSVNIIPRESANTTCSDTDPKEAPNLSNTDQVPKQTSTTVIIDTDPKEALANTSIDTASNQAREPISGDTVSNKELTPTRVDKDPSTTPAINTEECITVEPISNQPPVAEGISQPSAVNHTKENNPKTSKNSAPRLFGIFKRVPKATEIKEGEPAVGTENENVAVTGTKTSTVTTEEPVSTFKEPTSIALTADASPMEFDQPGSVTADNTPIPPVSVEAPSTSTISKDTPEPIVLRGPRKSPLVFKSGSTHKTSVTAKQVNIYMETRLKVLLALLQDQPMWELSKDLKSAYIEKAEAKFGPIKYAVCNKTLWRSARILAERGEAKTDTLICPLWNGDTVERKILIRTDVDMNGEDYTRYKKRTIERRTMQVNRTPMMELENTPASIERLEDRIARLKEEMHALQESGRTVEAKILQERIDDLSNNAQTFRPIVNAKPVAWLIARVQFGWVHARMLRIKTMYLYVFKLVTSDEDIVGVDKVNRTIDTSAIVNNMTLGLMCQIIGILRPAGFIVEYTRNPDNMNLKYNELPMHVKGEVFSDKNAFRRRLRSLLAALEYFDLIKPNIYDYKKVDHQIYANLANNYVLCDKVPIKDRKRLGQPTIREHNMETASEVSNFWGDFQYNCTQGQVSIPPEELEPPPENSWIEELWRGMYHLPNWSHASVFTRQQRKILNSYVDKVNSQTPVANANACLKISKETNLSVQTVRRYYEKVEVALSRKDQDRKMKEYRKKFYPSRASRKKPNPIGGRRVINLSSTRAFKLTHRKMAGTFVQSEGSLSLEDNEKIHKDSKSKGFEINLDDLNNAPVISGPAGLVTVRQGRIKRSSWNSHEDDLIIYSYAIARQRANGYAVRWFPINAMFPSKPTSAARNRLGRLVADPKYAEQLENATKQWVRFYVEGIESGEIRDPDPTEVTNYDLLSYLAYFIKRLSEDGPDLQTPLLPSSVEALNECFNIGRNLIESNPYILDDLFFSKTTLVTQMNTLYSHALFARRSNNETFDNSDSAWEKENDIRERQRRLLTNFSMMCLFTPTEVFDPFYSYSIIGLYPQEVFFEALKILRDHGNLILAKQERAIPGTKYTVSAKFNGIMAGHLPENVFKQANRFDKFLDEETGKIRFSPEYADSGTMVCLFDIMSEQKVNLTMANKPKRMKAIKNQPIRSRLIDRGLGYFEIDIEKTEKESPYFAQVNFEEKKLQDVDQFPFNTSVENFLGKQDEHSKELLGRVINLLEAEKDNGLTIYQLKWKLKDDYDDQTILLAVSLLESSNPALIVSVGFNAARYVTAAHIDTWFIRTRDATMHSAKIKIEPKDVLYPRHPSKDVVRKEFISPNLWTDINGNVTQLVLNECKTSIVDFLLRKPGSSDGSIYRKYQSAFDRKNIHDVLDLLVKQNVVRRVQVHQLSDSKARTSIFAKPRTLKCTNKPVIASATQSFYWVQPHYYRSIV